MRKRLLRSWNDFKRSTLSCFLFFWISGHISGMKRDTGDPLVSKRPYLGWGIMRTIVLVCENLISVTKVIVLLVEQPQLPERWTRADNLFVSDFFTKEPILYCKICKSSQRDSAWNIHQSYGSRPSRLKWSQKHHNESQWINPNLS